MQDINRLNKKSTISGKPAKKPHGDVCVLLVDDDDQFRNMLELMLDDYGFVVITSCNGRDAMNILHQNEVDLVVLDIIMPEQEGIETIQQIKRLYPELKIVAISGGGPFLKADTSLEIAKNMGANQILKKPFTHTELLNQIDTLIFS
jgi:DNA-binding NtrC family response regulator